MSIKTGDLVMVVKPTLCCGNSYAVGRVFVAQKGKTTNINCTHCGHLHVNQYAFPDNHSDGLMYRPVVRLKKIDPPAEGDSLPTRADIEVAA